MSSETCPNLIKQARNTRARNENNRLTDGGRRRKTPQKLRGAMCKYYCYDWTKVFVI